MRIDKENLVKILQSLVKIQSFSDSLAISRWIKGELLGFGYKVDADSDGNLITEIGPPGAPGFILNGHMDTVGPGDGWRHDPFAGEVNAGKLYGRGSSDMKAGLASMLEIARVLKESEAHEKLKKRVVFAFTAFEESYPIEMNGVHKSMPKLGGMDIEKGLILEPTARGKKIGIAVGCRGNAIFNIDILGKRGHSAFAPDSDNPIYMFRGFLQELERVPRRRMRFRLVNQQAEDKITVTQIYAMEGVNVVPGKCRISIDKRMLPGEKPGEFAKTLRGVCRKALGKDFKMIQESEKEGYYYEDPAFLELCKKGVLEAGCKPEPHFKLFRTDATILYNDGGIGTFMIGPGTDGQAHKIDEHCELEPFFRTTEVILGIIRKWDES